MIIFGIRLRLLSLSNVRRSGEAPSRNEDGRAGDGGLVWKMTR